MKKMIAVILVIFIAALSLWVWTIRPYVRTHDGIIQQFALGDPAGAAGLLESYRGSRASYLLYNLEMLGPLRARLLYNEGVLNGKLGRSPDAETAFRAAEGPAGPEIASLSLFNLSLIAIERNDYETARTLLERTLSLDPGDAEAKVNLELLARKMESRTPTARKETREGTPKPERGQSEEMWRLDLPEQDGQGGTGTRRSYL